MALSSDDSGLVAQGATIQVSIRRKVTRRRRRRGERRGVILLVIVGLLTLFTLIGLTFVLATSQGSLGAKAASRANRTGTPPPKLHRRALLQIVRGHQNPPANTAYLQWLGSVMGPHSLLEDFYGDDWLISEIPANGFATMPAAGAGAFCMGQGSMMYIEVSLYGADGQPGLAGIDDDGNGTVDDASELGYGDDFQPISGYYNGRVITMVDGAARGKSSRITGYQIIDLTSTPPLGRLRLLPFEGMTAFMAGAGSYVWNSQGAPQPGDTFIINGGAFNGTGFGFNPDPVAGTSITGLLDLADDITTGRPLALLPNPTSPDYRLVMSGADGIAGTADDLFANANEDYDAPDFQNMILAGQFWNAFATTPRWEVRVPSLHRPALINYWAAQAGSGSWTGVPPDLKRKISLRPLPEDHFKDLNGDGVWDPNTEPAFTGSNPNYDPINGPWDVDNLGGGLADSIWVDLGFPVQTAPDGRKYKALFAILCLDLDGKLNINVHSKPGDYRMISPAPGGPPDEEYVTTMTNRFPGPYAGAYIDANGNGQYDAGEVLTAVQLPIGFGYGVADVNLAVVLPDPVADSTTATGTRNELRQLIEGRMPGGVFSFAIPGRNGEPHLMYVASGIVPRPGSTSSGTLVHGGLFPSAFDDYYTGDDNRPLAVMGIVGGNTQAEYYGNLYQDGYFPGIAMGVNGSPPGLAGNGSVALDLRGQPFWWNSGYAGTPNAPAFGALQESIDDPYELDVTLRHRGASDPAAAGNVVSVDNPFAAAELERLLRVYDADALALPGRLGILAPSLTNPLNPNNRLLTTDSWDPPSPNVIPTYDMVVGEDSTPGTADDFSVRMAPRQPVKVNIADLLRYRLAQGAVPPATMDAEMAKLLSPDLLASLRMDINRPFGDGLDNNGNGVVDELLEALAGISGPAGADRLWRDPGADGAFGTMDDSTGVPFDANADGTIDFNDSLARYELAKHLYVLLMLFKDYNYSDPTPGEPGIVGADQAELTSRKLAQWAINAVDFRDRDSICTPFEYDANPFNGWTVDGFLGPHPVTGIDDSLAANPERGVVWGCEYPDLVLSEAKAVHDRRSEDLDDFGKTAMGTPPGMDPHFDQRRIPQGSAFIEIYNTRNPHNPALPGDLYTASGHLDLGRMDNNNTGTYPVWRLVVGERNDTPGTLADVPTLLQTRDESLGLDVHDMDMVADGAQAVDIDRIVWLGAGPPAPGVIDADKIYYNVYATSSDVLLGPGQYAVVGPHRNPESGDQNITTFGYTAAFPHAQEIRLGTTPATTGAGGRRSVIVSDVDGTPTTYPDDPVTTATPGTYEIQEPLGIAVAGDPTGTANAIWAGRLIGFSVSEPLFSNALYYPLPTDPTPTTVTHYDGSTTTWLDRYAPPIPDEPFDNANAELLALSETGTALNYKTVFLQRLADPTRAFDAVSNPYLTVDWMPIDLTVFNGEEAAAYPDPSLVPPDADIRFGTRQRGSPRDPAVAPDPDYYYNIWKQPDWIDPVNWPPIVAATQTTNFGYQLDHTLGYLNLPFHDPTAAPAWITTANVPTGEPYTDSNGNNTYDAGEPFWDANNNGVYDAADQLVQYVGDPLRPFPWLTWLNRPYASNMELLLVPHSSPGRLLHEFEVRTATENHYTDRNSAGTPPPFRHLLNFFHATDMNTTPPTWAGNYYRILEYVHVPSRFSGTQELLNPTVFQAGSTALAAGEGAPFYAPFNRVSRYRDPGRININTVFDDGRTWQGILNRLQESTAVDPAWTSGGFWSKVLRSRRGYDIAGIDNRFDLFNSDSPTFVSNPFRSFGHGYVVPTEPLRRVNTTSSGTLNLRASVEASLMRSDPDTGTSVLPEPLFAMHSTIAGTPSSDYINTDRNAHFRYQVLQKLGNTVTTRSNVYAIWITVGYFEVERGPIDVVHPDGYRLGQEMGIDTGDVKRDRAFYIYDRSIPVGFRRGENLNVEKGILVERVIE